MKENLCKMENDALFFNCGCLYKAPYPGAAYKIDRPCEAHCEPKRSRKQNEKFLKAMSCSSTISS